MKLGRSMIVAAVLVYVVVLGCVVLPAQENPAQRLSTDGSDTGPESPVARGSSAGVVSDALPYKGAAMQIQRVDWIDKYKHSIDEIAAMGFDSVSLVLDTRQENAESKRVYLDMRMTPTPDMLGQLIRHAKEKNLRVILMPVVLLDNPQGNDWRGVIRPDSWHDWFDSYRQMLIHFAWIAEQNKADVLSVGSELVSSEKERAEWFKTIRAVREVFHGQLTYSANWDHYASIPFWSELDLMGMNSYWDLGKKGSTRIDREDLKVDDIVNRWKEIQKDLLAFQKKINKPILFLEIGWCSLANAAHEPWDYTQRTLEVDNDLQKMLFEAFFRAWYRNPAIGGFMVWEWTPGEGGKATVGEGGQNPNEDEVEELHKGYTPENKPAQEVIKEWIAKPWRDR